MTIEIKQKIAEIEKGCGKIFKSFDKGRVGCDTQCGYQYKTNTRRHLCPSCQAKLETLKSCSDEITKLKEEQTANVEELKEMFKNTDEYSDASYWVDKIFGEGLA